MSTLGDNGNYDVIPIAVIETEPHHSLTEDDFNFVDENDSISGLGADVERLIVLDGLLKHGEDILAKARNIGVKQSDHLRICTL